MISLASKLFKLIKRNPNAAGGSTVIVPAKPNQARPDSRPVIVVTPKTPKRPGIKVAPVRKVVCIGGKVANNSCFCPARTKKFKIGANAYRCLVNVVRPNLPPRQVIKTAPVRRIVPARVVAPAGKTRRFGRSR